MQREPIETRFWKHVNKTDGCWFWIGAKNKGGYGLVYAGTTRKAHRISNEMQYGKFNDSLYVLHTCDNPCCVRPDHLFLGTQSDNMKDAGTKRRCGLQRHPELTRGERNGSSKLTNKDIIQIRQRYSNGNVTQYVLASDYHVSVSNINRIIHRVRWTHVKEM